MKLKVKGDYVKDGFLQFEPCEVIIEFGQIQLINFQNQQVFYGYQASYNSKYKLEKIFYEKYSKNLKYTYRILYQADSGKTKQINIKPNQFQVFKIKWAFSQYLIQTRDIKIEILKYLMIALLSFLGGIVFERYYN